MLEVKWSFVKGADRPSTHTGLIKLSKEQICFSFAYFKTCLEKQNNEILSFSLNVLKCKCKKRENDWIKKPALFWTLPKLTSILELKTNEILLFKAAKWFKHSLRMRIFLVRSVYWLITSRKFDVDLQPWYSHGKLQHKDRVFFFLFSVSFRSWGTGDKQKENYRKGVFLENHTDTQTHTKMHHTHTRMQKTHRKTCMYTSNNP